MRVRKIKLQGFRNLKDVELSFPESVNLFAFIGLNGNGKTNILESLFISGLSKSFRTRTNVDVIGFDDQFSRLDVLSFDGEKEFRLEVIVTRSPSKKTLKVNGVIKSAVDFVGHLPVVFFSPDDMTEMASAPRFRRRYLDVLMAQIDHGYFQILLDYSSALTQRNALLRRVHENKSNISELEFWDDTLVRLGKLIMTDRQTLIGSLSGKTSDIYQAISRKKDLLQILYHPSVSADHFEDKLFSDRERDLFLGSTSHGPHRDDLEFLLNGNDMIQFSSRGEWRSLVLALKFAEMELLRDSLGTSPILLLDDVFSELDEQRQRFLLSQLSNIQVFVTTTHLEFLSSIDIPKMIYEVKEGVVEQAF